METCYHCDTDCVDEIVFEQKIFCCEGCKTVYEILSSNSLNNYYDLNVKPGTKSKDETTGKYKYLDLEDIKSKLLLFSESNVSKIRLSLPQIHCSSCLWLLEQLHKLNKGIIRSEVNFVEKEAEITFNNEEVSLRDVVELVARIGYPPAISLSDYDKPQKKRNAQKLVIQIGVVGFCFGNIMLMSFPEYFGLDETFSNFQSTFNGLNLLLSIPILFFGARGYIVSSFKALRVKTVNIDVPITLGIFALYFRSVYEIVTGVGAGYFDSFAGLIFFLLIGKWFQQKTYSAINFERDYKSYFPIAATKVVGDEYQTVPLSEVNVGDQLIIRNNELIPADSVLIDGDGHIDYSFVSGESTLVSKMSGDQIYAGGKQKGASLLIEIVKAVENSYLTRLWNNPIFHTKKERSNLSDSISKYFTLAIILIAAVAGVVWSQIDPSRTAFIITSILIIACPCAIALSVPFTYGSTLRVLARKSFFVRSIDVVEPLAEVTDVVFDKTGTLTKSDEMDVSWDGGELSEDQKQSIFSLAFQSSHPLSKRICAHLKVGKSKLEVKNLEEISASGLQAIINGEVWKLGSGSWIKPESSDNQTAVHVQVENTYLGCFVFGNTYRFGIEKLIKNLADTYKVHVLSGDNDSEKNYLSQLDSKLILNFNQTPENKLNYIQQLQSSGQKVLMLGDGLNDAGAIKQAEVGIAVVDDVYAFSPSSDAILEGSKLFQLQAYLNFAAYSKKVVWLSYGFSILYNIVGMYFALSGQLTPLVAAILMPLSSISVVTLVTALVNLKGRKVI